MCKVICYASGKAFLCYRLTSSFPEPLKQQWADRVAKASAAINASTIADWDTRFQLVQAMRSALQTGWTECLFVNGDSNEVTYSTEFLCALLDMKVGDCMYIGAVLSYQY